MPGPDKANAETPQYTDPSELEGHVATFAAGCFWGVESKFKKVEGVIDTTVGYTGGTTSEPTYKQVCSGSTGHAEAIQIEYDPSVVSYEELLDVFWSIHDPTQLDRQGPDIGTQYRSAIFYHGEEQQQQAEASKARLNESGRYTKPIVTRIEPASRFWAAEDYHQDYFDKNDPFPW
ncbi:MAG: peptide-methionine (S)-S-oxide reductase MsrA [Chloroflexota bacterium]